MGKKVWGVLMNLEPETLWIVLLGIWIVVMYGHSLTPVEVSSQESGWALARAKELAEALLGDSSWLTEHLIRKTAHFCEYTVFGLLLMQNVSLRLGKGSRRRRESRGGWIILALAVLGVPFLDETLQLFSAGRSAQISDVWLDMAGACFGLAIWMGMKHLMENKRRRRRRRNWSIR